MNIKKSVAGLVAGFALLGSIAAPAALADTAQTTATVNVTDGGAFTVSFCGAVSLTQDTAPQAESDGSASGSLHVCYTDTKSYREAFNLRLSTTDFNTSPAVTTIPANKLSVKATYNVEQDHWTSGPPVAVPRYGDIGFYVNEVHVSQNVPNDVPQPWTAGGTTLETGKLVQYGWAGRGTTHSDGQIDLSLVIPKGTSAGTYTSQLTITLTFEEP